MTSPPDADHHAFGAAPPNFHHLRDTTHEIGRKLAADLCRHGGQQTGHHGLPAEAVLRCALLKQYRQLSYQELAFHLEHSA